MQFKVTITEITYCSHLYSVSYLFTLLAELYVSTLIYFVISKFLLDKFKFRMMLLTMPVSVKTYLALPKSPYILPSMALKVEI